MVCSVCRKEKNEKDFGIHVDRRGPVHVKRIKRCCKKCECEKAKVLYRLKKDTEAFKEYNRKKAADYYATNYERCKNRNKKYGSSEYYKQKRRIKLREKSSDQNFKNHRNRKGKEYNKKNIDNLTDHYLIVQLKKDGHEREWIDSHPELIEAKRIILKIKRKIRNYGN